MKRFLFLLLISLFILHCYYYYPYLSDDSLISLRYTDRFLQGKGLTWNDNERPVEGYSNLSWIILISIFGKLGFNLILSLRLAGLICSISVLYIIYLYYKDKDFNALFVGLSFLICTSAFATWTIAGLEQPLYTLSICLMIYSVFKIIDLYNFRKYNWLLSISLAVLVISRPDGVLFSVITSFFFFFFLLYQKRPYKFIIAFLIKILSLPIIFYVSQLLFRLNYYGEWLPNTAFVKAKVTLYTIWIGLIYSARAFINTLPFSIIGILFIIYFSIVKKNSKFIYLLAVMGSWVVYVTLVGGDIFPAFRHFVLVYVILTYALIEGFIKCNFKFFKTKYFLAIFTFICIPCYLYLQINYSSNKIVKHEKWEWDGLLLGEFLKRGFYKQQPLLGVTAAGCIPYSSNLPCLDMLGLNDYYIARHPPKDYAKGGYIGHELGDVNYILKRNSDILIFTVGQSTPSFRIGEELKKNNEFLRKYKPVLFTINDSYNPTLFMNKYGDKLGISEYDKFITIPGYLLGDSKNNVVALDKKDNKFKTKILFNKTATITLNSKNKKWRIYSINNQKPDLNNIKITLTSNFKNDSITINLTSLVKEIDIDEIKLAYDK